MIRNWDWDDTWKTLIFAVVVLIVIAIARVIAAPDKIDFYSLNESNGHFTIEVHADWKSNDLIGLDRSVTLEQAVQAVNSLNLNLKH